MFTAGLLRLLSRFSLLVVLAAIFMGMVIQKEAQVFWYVTAAVFLAVSLFTSMKGKEQSIKARTQIEEKERARIKANQR